MGPQKRLLPHHQVRRSYSRRRPIQARETMTFVRARLATYPSRTRAPTQAWSPLLDSLLAFRRGIAGACLRDLFGQLRAVSRRGASRNTRCCDVVFLSFASASEEGIHIVYSTFRKDVRAEVGPWMLLSLRLLISEGGGRDELPLLTRRASKRAPRGFSATPVHPLTALCRRPR